MNKLQTIEHMKVDIKSPLSGKTYSSIDLNDIVKHFKNFIKDDSLFYINCNCTWEEFEFTNFDMNNFLGKVINCYIYDCDEIIIECESIPDCEFVRLMREQLINLIPKDPRDVYFLMREKVNTSETSCGLTAITTVSSFDWVIPINLTRDLRALKKSMGTKNIVFGDGRMDYVDEDIVTSNCGNISNLYGGDLVSSDCGYTTVKYNKLYVADMPIDFSKIR
jgi:hypothetical protein